MRQIQPLVSICTITYNHAAYIKDCIEGVLMQKTDFPIEFIIHDDASTDGTAEIVREYAEKHPDIIIPVLQKENQYSKKINIIETFVFPLVKGEYIALCEGDDYWIDPLKLQKQVDYMEEHPDCTLLWSDVDALYQETGKFEYSFLKRRKIKNTTDDFIINAWFCAPCTWLFRKSAHERLFDATSPYLKTYSVGDYPLLLSLSINGNIAKIPNSTSTAVYRILSQSASHNSSIYEQIKFRYKILNIQTAYANYLKSKFSTYIKMYTQCAISFCKIIIRQIQKHL